MSEVRRTAALTRNKTLLLGARFLFGLFFLMTSSYCLLAYIPFTYQWVIKCTLVKWLPIFVKLHPFLYWIVIGLVTVTLLPEFARPRSRRLAAGFIIVHAAAGVLLLFRPLLANLPDDARSFYWSLISLFPLLWIAAIDYAGHCRERKWAQTDDEHLAISTAVMAAGFLSLLYVGVFYLRMGSTEEVQFRSSELLIVLTWSLASHLLIFTFAFVALRLIRSFARKFTQASWIEFSLCNLLIALVLTLLVRRTILPALTFNGYFADVISVAVSFSAVALMSGVSIRLHSANEAMISSGFRLTLSPLLFASPGKNSPKLVRIGWLGLLALVAYAIPAIIATRDWDFLMQKVGAVAVWFATFVSFYSIQSPGKRRNYTAVGLLLIVVVSVGWYTILGWSGSLWPALLNDERLDVSATLERYGGYDVSFKLARDILRPTVNLFPSTGANPTETTPSGSRDQSFYGFLQQNTNLPSSVKVSPLDIKLAGELTPTEGEKPNIFIFVIDSLRQDYISPYNKAVTFTPNIESFARESLVMRNAFTRYGGTVLAEPSIWTGTLQLHKQYIEPFYPMNSLQKLIEVEGYESFVTIDPVVRIVTKPSPDVTALDKDYLWFEYDFCRTLKELQAKIDERQTAIRPMFVYTQPQNLHRMFVKDKNDPIPPGEGYPGFDAPYASQVKYMDKCFGEFIEYLKIRRLYDNSIVILTSDHGDSLGEEGRWGHSYWMFPEILKVPLLVHLPPRLQKGSAWNPQSIAFTTDITPTLYYLLGHRPVSRNPMFGRPLITTTEKEQIDYLQKFYLVVSSYGPVYGILSGDARSLFIADAVNQKDYFFNLADDLKGMRNRLTADIQVENEKRIHDLVVSVNQFYNLGEYP